MPLRKIPTCSTSKKMSARIRGLLWKYNRAQSKTYSRRKRVPTSAKLRTAEVQTKNGAQTRIGRFQRPRDRSTWQLTTYLFILKDLRKTRDSTSSFGAEEGTRTPTPLRVHGPEPCASANSATSARETCSGQKSRAGSSFEFRKAGGWCQIASPPYLAHSAPAQARL